MNPALAAAVDTLEAERLAPVPRASHAVSVDADDLSLVLHHVRAAAAALRPGRAAPGMTAGTAAAAQRLECAVRAHADTSPAAAGERTTR